MIKKCLSRILVLLISMGLSTVFTDISLNKKYLIVIYSFSYFVSYSIYEISRILFFYHYFTKATLMILVIPVCLIDALMFVWIFIELRNTINELEETKQTFKLYSYSNFRRIIFIYVLFSINWMILNILFDFIENFKPFYYLNFIFDCVWEILYFFIFISICFIWKPNENNERYIESKQIADEDEDELLDGMILNENQINERDDEEEEDQKDETLDQNLLEKDENMLNENV